MFSFTKLKIEWKILEKFYIQNPKNFVEIHLKDGIELSNAYLHPSLLTQFEDNVLQTLQNETWTDLLVFLIFF